MSNKKIITITFSVAITHFILTSVIGHFIAIQIGTQLGQAVPGGLIEAIEDPNESEEEASKIYQNMKNNADYIIEKWKVPMILLSLPIKPIIRPMFSKVGKVWVSKRLKEIETEEELRIFKEKRKIKALIIDNVENAINSFAFGLLVYIAIRLIINYRLKHNKAIERDAH